MLQVVERETTPERRQGLRPLAAIDGLIRSKFTLAQETFDRITGDLLFDSALHPVAMPVRHAGDTSRRMVFSVPSCTVLLELGNDGSSDVRTLTGQLLASGPLPALRAELRSSDGSLIIHSCNVTGLGYFSFTVVEPGPYRLVLTPAPVGQEIAEIMVL